VRTIFEEGWSEIDHNIRYPNFSDNPLTNNLLMILNRLAGSADEMSSFVQELSSYLLTSQDQFKELERARDEQVANLQKIIDKSSTSQEDKSTLQGVADTLVNVTNSAESVLENANNKHSILNHMLLSKFIRSGIRDTSRDGRQLEEGEETSVSQRMKSFIEQQVGVPKPGHLRLMAPLTYDEGVRLYNAVLEEFPGALYKTSGIAGREAVAAVADNFLNKIDRVKISK
jgi:hypothetical protein